MLAFQLNIVSFFIFLHVSNCARRIQDGFKITSEKPYVVYLVKAPVSKTRYDYWICGGALVTPEFVVTSAACIQDVDYLYVIAGYNKYITDQELELDPCTSEKKKKVIYTCYPEGYNLKYDRLDRWSFIDIGVAKVESPYDFGDQTYKTKCSYIPGTIPINTENKYQRAGLDAIVLGWGHKSQWRKPQDHRNYNQKILNYASVKIIDKKDCRSQYEEYGRMDEVITKYMICTLGDGILDEFGIPAPTESGVISYGCSKRKSLALNPDENLEDCEYDDEDETRRGIMKSSNVSMIKVTTKNNVNKIAAETNITTVSKKRDLIKSIAALSKKTHSIKRFTVTNRPPLRNSTYLTNITVSSQETFMNNNTHYFNEAFGDTRKGGICQNDHGGPLVTWIGSHEILIGVASVFKVSDDYKCEGPYLYTSTQCNGAFLNCILEKADWSIFDNIYRRSSSNVTDYNRSRRSFCQRPSDDKKHQTTERHISWLYHPAGPADHERHLTHDRNKPVNKQAPEKNEENININGMGISQENEQYSIIQKNQKSSVNVNNAPNEKFNENIAPIVNQRGTPNSNFVTNHQYPPSDVPGIINEKFSPYKRPPSNNRPTSINGPASNNGPASQNGPASNNATVSNNAPTSNNGSAPYNRFVSNNGPASNNAPAYNNGPTLNNGPASYNRPVSNNGPASNNGPILNNWPVINYKSERNNDQVLRDGPVLNIKYKLINNQASNNRPALRDKGPASVISPKLIYKYAASKKPEMRPTLPLRI